MVVDHFVNFYHRLELALTTNKKIDIKSNMSHHCHHHQRKQSPSPPPLPDRLSSEWVAVQSDAIRNKGQ